ncbi:MAG: proprotein convertase P-domain-containing protein [Rhodanobacteraceae bacterium]
MKRFNWGALSALLVAVAAVGGVVVHTIGPFSGERGEHEGMKPVSTASRSANVPAQSTGMIAPHVVTFRNLPVVQQRTGQSMTRPGKDEHDSGEENEKRERSQLTEAQADALRAMAMEQPVQRARIQELRDVTVSQRKQGPASPSAGGDVLNVLNGFDGPDISQCCVTGASVPPDPHLAVGQNHVIAAVNDAIGIYDKQGQLLNGPVTSDSFFGSISAQCSGTFDPTVEYDEGADRFIINYDASPNNCIAVSQTGDPTGAWNLYSFATGAVDANGDLFDYPHIGVGDQAIYVGANMFFGSGSFAGRVWALDKTAMYAGSSLPAPTPHDLMDSGNADGTPTPMVLHGTPSASGTVFIITDNPGFTGNTFGVWKWTDPTGVLAPTLVGYADLAAATGVTASFPLDQTQLGTPAQIQGNDWRTLDAEWRNGHLWMTHQMSCNVGAGPFGCARWAEIDPMDASVVQAGVVTIFGKSISFPNLAVDANDNMALGFTVMGPSKRPSVYVAARAASDPAGTLREAQEVKRGDTIYAAFDGSPGRWGDYSGMAADPDGQHLWYLGEYSKGGMASPYVPNEYGNWGTYIQELAIGPDDNLFADGFDPPSASLELHAEVNLDDADTAPGAIIPVGDPVQLRYVVINTGQQRLNSVLVIDDLLGVVTCPTNVLEPGADMICDVDNGPATGGLSHFSASVTAEAADGTAVSSTDQSYYSGFDPLAGTKCTDAGGTGCPEALVDSPAVGTNGTVTSSFTVSGCGTIDDVNVGLSIDHTYVGDLLITLKSPDNTSITLINSPIGGADNCGGSNVRTLLDDASSNGNVDQQCGSSDPSIYGTFQPSSPLSGFNTGAGNGTWTLTIEDVFPQDTGTLNDWSLQLTCH